VSHRNLSDHSSFQKMTKTEMRVTLLLASIYALRMFGLFMILPVFSLYAEKMDNITPFLIGLAISIYGLTQALFQIPFGLLSDKFGRKPLLLIGLSLFIVGSVVAATADSIMGIIIGRAIQGSGAIAAVVMAMAADLTREEHRTKVMAMIGMSIGLSFMLAMVFGPLLKVAVGVQGMFWLTAIFSIIAILLVVVFLPKPIKSRQHRDAQPVVSQFKGVLTNPDLIRLDAGVFLLHLILTAGFVVIPLVLYHSAGIAEQHHGWFYFAVLLVSVIIMVPFIIIAERHKKMKLVFLGAIAFIGIAQVSLAMTYQWFWGMLCSMIIFFSAFNLLEATLPSIISKLAPADSKGTAMGVYSTSQFLGAFLGGSLGGWLYGQYGYESIFIFCAGCALIWFMVAFGMSPPGNYSSHVVMVGPLDKNKTESMMDDLMSIHGVKEVVLVAEDGVAYLKVNKKELDYDALAEIAQ
jgi:predicted MFS family arabinose efflux permease